MKKLINYLSYGTNLYVKNYLKIFLLIYPNKSQDFRTFVNKILKEFFLFMTEKMTPWGFIWKSNMKLLYSKLIVLLLNIIIFYIYLIMWLKVFLLSNIYLKVSKTLNNKIYIKWF